MEIATTIKSRIFFDERGSFSPLSLNLLGKTWIQSNVSFNPKKWTLRGLHFQKGEFAQAKLIKVINGKILDFVFDMRNYSFNEELSFFEMSAGDEIIIPRGYAHGFITLEENTVVQYLVDNEYNPNSEGVLVWTDFPELLNKIKNLDNNFSKDLVIVSDKDLIEK